MLKPFSSSTAPPTYRLVWAVLIPNVGTPHSHPSCLSSFSSLWYQNASFQTGDHLQCCFTTFIRKFRSCNCLLIWAQALMKDLVAVAQTCFLALITLRWRNTVDRFWHLFLHAFLEIRAQPPTAQCPPQTKTCILIPEHAWYQEPYARVPPWPFLSLLLRLFFF